MGKEPIRSLSKPIKRAAAGFRSITMFFWLIIITPSCMCSKIASWAAGIMSHNSKRKANQPTTVPMEIKAKGVILMGRGLNGIRCKRFTTMGAKMPATNRITCQ
jgi:hypothetical protein